MKFGLFVPQGWRHDLVGIDPEQHWGVMAGIAARADGHIDNVVIVLDANVRRRVIGRGSAIFFHCARADLGPTAGCVALRPADMRRLLARLTRDAAMIIA